MSLVDEFILGPLDKWRKFRKPPWKLALHILLTALLSTYCMILNRETADLSRLMDAEWQHYLYPEDAERFHGDERDYFGATYFVPDVNRLRTDAQRLIAAYFDLPRLALDTYAVHAPGARDIPAPQVTFETYNDDGVGATTVRMFRPTNASEARAQLPWGTASLQSLRTLHIELHARSADLAMRGVKRWRCLQWRIDVEYSSVAGRQLQASLRSFPQRCPNTGSTVTVLLVLALAAAAAAVVYQALVGKAAVRNVVVLNELRAAVRQRAAARARARTVRRAKSPPRARRRSSAAAAVGAGAAQLESETGVVLVAAASGPDGVGAAGEPAGAGGGEGPGAGSALPGADVRVGVRRRTRKGRARLRDLTASDAAHLLNVWVLVSTAANVCTVWFAAVEATHAAMADGADAAYAPRMWWRQRFLLGAATGCAWIGALQYLEFNAELYILIRTMNRAMPRVGKYMAAVFPVFFGYTFFGVVLFGDAVLRFGNVRDTAITLFAVLNGDSIRETFTDVLQHRAGWVMALIAYAYLFSFCMWFIYLVLMCFVAIVEEAFFAAREYAITRPKAQRSLPPHLHVLLAGKTADKSSERAVTRQAGSGGPLPALAGRS